MILNAVLIFVAAVALTLIITLVLRNPGPWKSFWVFLGVLFLAMWAFSLWVTPIGPVWHDIARLDTLLLGLLLALLLGSMSESRQSQQRTPAGELDLLAEAKKESTNLFGIFFWIFIAGMILTIAMGIIRIVNPLY